MIRVCAEPGCPNDTIGTHCDTHQRQPWAGSTRRRRLPSDWERTRQLVLRRDGHRCQTCGGPANQVDHIRRGDDHHPSNLQALCTPCHSAKSAAEGGSAPRR